jgi:hypothetical protein
MSAQLELHAKVYYDDPNLQGGDEFIITVHEISHNIKPITGRGTRWVYDSGSAWDQPTPFGGYLHVYAKFNGDEEVGFVGATLTLSTTISYWGSIPTGSYSQMEWQGELLGSDWKITSITV